MPISYANARARIERLLDPTPLPDRQWVFLHSLYELAPHATPAEKVAVFLRSTTPHHDAARRFFEPVADALVAAITARATSHTTAIAARRSGARPSRDASTVVVFIAAQTS